MTPSTWWIVGGGRIGASLALDLATAEPPVLVIDVHPVGSLAGAEGVTVRSWEDVRSGRARETASPTPDVAGDAPEGVGARGAAPQVIFAVPDDELAATAGAWARAAAAMPALRPGIAIHTSGLHPAAILDALRPFGTAVGSWHPMVAVAAPAVGRFEGRTITLEGDAEAIRLGERLAALVGAPSRVIPTEGKARHHAAAVFASNYVVACLSVAARLGAEGAPEELRSLVDLARSALDGVEAAGVAGGLTGPIARGDVETLRAHLRALDPATRDLYRGLARETLHAAETTLGADVAERIRQLLDPGGTEDGSSEGGAGVGQ